MSGNKKIFLLKKSGNLRTSEPATHLDAATQDLLNITTR